MDQPLRQPDDRPAAGAAAAATAGAADVDEALDLIEQGFEQLAGVDATTLPEGCVTTAVRRLGKLDGRLDGFQARFVAAAEAAGLPERSGANSTTSWLSQQTGRSGGQSARTGRLAKAAGTTPELTDAVANGAIGPDQANTIASGLDRGEFEPEDVEELLPAARRQSPSMFRRRARQVAGRRRQERLRNQELVARDQRRHSQWRTPDGSLRYEGLLPPAEGDRMEKAIGAFYQPDGKDVPDDQRRTHDQRAADAMTALLEAALRAGEAGDVGGVRPTINVVVPHEAMSALADAEAAGVTAVSDCGTVLSMAAFKKLTCDAAVRRTVIGPDSQPLDVGRATRQWPAPMRAAIAAVDGGCRGPGCDLPPDRCIVHHVSWWESGGSTSVDNGSMLCGHHHDLVHDQGWTLQMAPATRRCTWTAPDGTVLMTDPRGPGAREAMPSPPAQAAPKAGSTTPPSTSTTSTMAGAPADRTVERIRPLGRGDPGRPRSPGSDPPPDDRASPPCRKDHPEPLRLEL